MTAGSLTPALEADAMLALLRWADRYSLDPRPLARRSPEAWRGITLRTRGTTSS